MKASQKLYELLTPLVVTGQLTVSQVSEILAQIKVMEIRLEVLDKLHFDKFATEHAEHNDYSRNGSEGEESESELKINEE